MKLPVKMTINGQSVSHEVEPTVPGEQLEHMVEETDSRADVVTTLALDRQPERDVRFSRLAVDYRAAHSTSSKAATSRRVCDRTPVVMRMQPAHPGSLERSRR